MDEVEICFSAAAWEDYTYWINQDKKTLKKINELIKDISRNGNSEGIGKPEPLKHELSGYYSRRINQKDRIIYKLAGDKLYILVCRTHYENI